MGQRIIKIAPELVQEMLTTGYTIGGERITVVKGLPPGAKFISAMYDGSAIVLLFEHESWPIVEDSLFEITLQRTQG